VNITTVELMIQDAGYKIPGDCSLCKDANLYEIEGSEGRKAKVCSWCDVAVDKRWSGHREMDAA
jgi:hypothetical protein